MLSRRKCLHLTLVFRKAKVSLAPSGTVLSPLVHFCLGLVNQTVHIATFSCKEGRKSEYLSGYVTLNQIGLMLSRRHKAASSC